MKIDGKNVFIKETELMCWSCDTVMTITDKQNNDGDCIYCGVEIDTSESPYTLPVD